MRRYSVPAAYARYVEAQLAIAMEDVARDRLFREEHDDVRQFAKVPDTLIDPDATGCFTIVCGVEPGLAVVSDGRERKAG